MDAIIHTEQLTKRYGATTALDRLDLDIYPGEIFGLLGPNGAGKTTAIKLVLNLILPTSGTVTLFGRPPGNISIMSRVGYLPEVLSVHDYLKASEFLRFHGQLCGIKSNLLTPRIDRLLDLVGLSAHRRQTLRSFSKGMLQRIGFAQALINDPQLLILDEPTSGLDPIGRKEMRDIFLNLKEQGVAIILNSHILSEIEKSCDRVGILKHGELIHLAETAYLSDSPDSTARAVEIQVNNRSDALMTLLDHACVSIRDNGKKLSLTLKRSVDISDIPRIVETAGAELVALIPIKETLEDLFYRLISSADGGKK